MWQVESWSPRWPTLAANDKEESAWRGEGPSEGLDLGGLNGVSKVQREIARQQFVVGALPSSLGRERVRDKDKSSSSRYKQCSEDSFVRPSFPLSRETGAARTGEELRKATRGG